jgi:phage-related protein
METVYFYDKDSKNCPVKKYLKQYLINNKDKEPIVRRKQKILADIDAKIQHVQDNQGRPTPPISKPLHGYSCFEILNPKDSKTVIRILYFRYQEKIVLLHAFEKPSSYKTDKKKKMVNRQNKIGEKYLNIFKLNPKNYEKY